MAGLTFRLGQLPDALQTDTSNNIGIGAAPSGTYKLEVTGTAKVSSTLLVSGAATLSSTLTTTGIGINYTGTLAAKLHITAASSTSYAPMIALRDPDNPTYGFTFKLDTAVNGDMRIDRVNAGTDAAVMSFQRSTGNVGIGTTTPDNLLVVSGNTGSMKLEATTTNRSAIQIFNTANTLYIGVDNASASYFGYAANSANIQTLNYPIIFSNGSGAPLERMRITSGGNVCINTTSINGRLGTNTKLTVAGSGSNAAGNSGASMGAVAGTGSAAIDTGINVEATDGGLTLLFLASRNTSSGTNTASAVYIISFYYNSNFPVVTYLGGTSNFVTFGQSGNNLTATNAIGYGNFNCSWFASK